MKRILVWFWSGGGGGSQFAAHLAQRLALRFGSAAVTLSLRADDPTIAGAEARGLKVLHADVRSDRKRPFSTALSLAGSADVLKAHVAASRADVVVLAMNFAAAAPLAMTLDKPLIYCTHDPSPHEGDYAAFGQRVTQAMLLRRAHTIVALSHFAALQLEAQRVSPASIRTVPLASVFEPVAQPVPIQDAPVRLLMIGRMIAYKGLSLLPEALAGIAGRDDWRLTIAGHGPALTEPVSNQLSALPHVRVQSGWMSEAETDALIDAHDLVLAPYLSATQSGVVAQAMARGRAVVATPVGALPEQVGDGGWIAAGATGADFSRSLVQALADGEERRAKANAAYALAMDAWRANSWSWLEGIGA